MLHRNSYELKNILGAFSDMHKFYIIWYMGYVIGILISIKVYSKECFVKNDWIAIILHIRQTLLSDFLFSNTGSLTRKGLFHVPASTCDTNNKTSMLFSLKLSYSSYVRAHSIYLYFLHGFWWKFGNVACKCYRPSRDFSACCNNFPSNI